MPPYDFYDTKKEEPKKYEREDWRVSKSKKAELSSYYTEVTKESKSIEDRYGKESSMSRADMGAMGVQKGSELWDKSLGRIDTKYQAERTELSGGVMQGELDKYYNRELQRIKPGWEDAQGDKDYFADKQADYESFKSGGTEGFYGEQFGDAPAVEGDAIDEADERARQATSGTQYGT